MAARALSLSAVAAAAFAAQRPNIIWFITDDQDLLLDSPSVMPTLQKELIGKGLHFTEGAVVSPKCCPSRTSAMSQRYPHNLNAQSLGWCGNFEAQHVNNTFVTDLQAAGYRTSLTGKYFNQEGSFCGANSHVYKDWGWSDFYAICKEVLYYNYPVNDNGVMRNFGNASTDYMTSVLGNHSVTWLSQAVASGQPFFAYMAPHAPHLPAIPAPWYADVPMPAQAPRTPNWNADVTGKHWAVASNDPMTAETIAGSDLLYGNRLRTLLSVDDWLQEVFSILETTGAINNTVIIYTSDHGYHTGQFRIWGEKSQPWVTDFRIPFYARAPGMTGNTSLPALVTNLDVPSTILELAGVQPAGGRTVDGKSFARFLAPATATATATAASTAPAPAAADIGADATSAGWRDRLLVEFEGYPLQYLRTCDSVYGTQACTPQSQEVLIDAESNTYAALRILNDTSNWVYVEYRPPGSPLAPASTNWTEAYNLSADPWQMSNLWPSGAPASLLQQLSKELWQLAACSGASCP